MKKIILGLLALLLVVIVGALGYLSFQSDNIIAKLKPEIEAQGSAALQSKLSIGEMHLKLFPSIAFSINSLTIAENKDETKRLSFGGGAIHVSLFKLFTGTVAIKSIFLDSPAITIHQTQSGVKIDGLSQLGQKATVEAQAISKADSADTEDSQPSAPSSLPGWLQVNLDSVSLENGRIQVYQESGEVITVQDIQLDTGISLKGSKLLLSELVASLQIIDQGNFRVELSEGEVDLQSLTGTLKKTRTEVSLARGALDTELTIRDARVSPQEFGMSSISFGGQTPALHKFSGDFENVRFLPSQTKIAIEAGSIKALKGQITLQGALSLSSMKGEMTMELNEIEKNGEKLNGLIAIRGNGNQITLTADPIEIFGGKVSSTMNSQPQKDPIPFSIATSLLGIDIERLTRFALPKSPILVTGNVEKLTANASGQTGTDMAKHLSADLSLLLREGSFTGGNIAALVLQSLEKVPFVKSTMSDAVPGEHSGAMSDSTTPIRQLNTTAKIKNERIEVNSLLMESALFSLEGRGTINFDQSLNLKATFRFIAPFSLAVVAKVPELNKLLDKENRLVIPLQIIGTATTPVILPNIEEILKLGAGKALQEKATGFIGKALGKGSSSKSGKSLFGF